MALRVERSMLQGSYTWDSSEEAGPLDAALFGRRKGPEILKMTQAIIDRLKLTDEADVHRVERLIADDLPGSIRKWERVEAWLLKRLTPENSAISYVKSLPSLNYGLIYYPDPEVDEYEFAGDLIAEAFADATLDSDGIVVYPYPGREGMEHAGAYIYGGIDPQSGHLVGFMVPNVLT